MDDSLSMSRGQGRSNGREQSHGFTDVQGLTASKHLRQCFTNEQVHDQRRGTIGQLEHRGDRHDGWVINDAGQASLGKEASAHVVLPLERRLQHLQGDGLVRRQVGGRPDCAHTTLTDQVVEAVVGRNDSTRGQLLSHATASIDGSEAMRQRNGFSRTPTQAIQIVVAKSTLELNVLVIDERPDGWGNLFDRAALQVAHAEPAIALDALDRVRADAVLVTVRASDDPVLQLIGRVAARHPSLPVVVLAAADAIDEETAVEAGAADLLRLPVDAEQLARAVSRNVTLARRGETATEDDATGEFIGESKAMGAVRDLIRRAAPGRATILVRGESGTGKELVARALHASSDRSTGPFVKIHCAALPDTLLESELFGYEKGAFTGATARKPGRVELAAGGTLFLDEIGDITGSVQVKLLRLLQDRAFERLGGTQTLDADVRFVAATHRDLERMVKNGEFREDLFYRLNVVPLWLPPLRARRGDIARLASHFCAVFSAANHKPDVTLGPDALAVLSKERWPGNVRQLQNFVERLVVLGEPGPIGSDDIKRELRQRQPFVTQAATAAQTNASLASEVIPLQVEVRKAERRAIQRALAQSDGNRSVAARLLGISRGTLYNKLQEHGL